jgi:lysophospholipase L1-like esterase
MKSMTTQSIVRYVPIGDSYTIGEGVDLSSSYPSLLAEHLTKEGFPTILAENPAVSGYTTSDAIIYEIPIFTSSYPTFATVLLGANDIAQGISKNDFKENYKSILNSVQKTLPNKKNLILITIPDFSITPVGATIGLGRNVSAEIDEFNNIIKEEGKIRGVPVVDLTVISREMEADETLVLSDGLHPSGKAYMQWEAMLFPVARKILSR